MAWEGWVSYAGNEIINVARTEAYAKNDGASWLIARYKIPELAQILGDDPYRSPLQDADCPWADPDEPASYGFYGLYPLSIEGLESSSRTSTVVENTTNGGNPGAIRHATKSVVFSAMLLGESDAAVEYGMRWLRAALLPNCDSSSCEGSDLCYFSAEPAYDPEIGPGCATDMIRHHFRVGVNQGPTITAKNRLSDGSAVWTVTFTAVAGIPFEFGDPVYVIRQLFDANVPNVAGGDLDAVGHNVGEISCPPKTWQPVFDPNCPDLILPPAPPSIKLSCYAPPKMWLRRSFEIPAELIPSWTEMVPIITLRDRSIANPQNYTVRNWRIRIYSAPRDDFNPDANYCNYCGDMVITYLPKNGSTMVLDGRDESVVMLTPGQSRRADSLVVGTDGKPFEWPSLTCGNRYLVTIDRPVSGTSSPGMDFALVPRAR